MEQMKIVIKGTKSKQGKYYIAIIADMGYRKIFLSTANYSDMAEMLGITMREYSELRNRQTEFEYEFVRKE